MSEELHSEIKTYFGLSNVRGDGADLNRIEQLAAAIDSANYLSTKMARCIRYRDHMSLLISVMNDCTNGLLLEFGVSSGFTINKISENTHETVFGFDSFEGLPDDWRPGFERGTFKLSQLPQVRSNVELIVGLFEETLPAFLKKHLGPAAFIHVDSDLYSSARTILFFLRDRIKSGTIIVFDEYFNYVGWRNHEFKAWQEFVAETGFAYRYIGVVPSHQTVAVQVL